MSWFEVVAVAWSIMLISWVTIVVYVAVEDRRERRRAGWEVEQQRWRQTIDAYRRAYEQDR